MTDQQAQNGQPQHPETYTLPAELVSAVYRLIGQIASAQAARVFVRLENEIGRQNEAHRVQAVDEPVAPKHAETKIMNVAEESVEHDR